MSHLGEGMWAGPTQRGPNGNPKFEFLYISMTQSQKGILRHTPLLLDLYIDW
jgi:hypothetical protein